MKKQAVGILTLILTYYIGKRVLMADRHNESLADRILTGLSHDAQCLVLAIGNCAEYLPTALEDSNITEVQAGIIWAVGNGWSGKRYKNAYCQLEEHGLVERVKKDG